MIIKMNMIIFSTFIIIISSLSNCPKSKPIFYQDECWFRLFKKRTYEIGKCVVANKIAKIQWITSVIFIGMSNTFVYFQKYQNGDLILEILPAQGSYTRMIYKLKQNEEHLLVKDGEFTPYLTLNSNNYSHYDGNLYIIKIEEDEYPVFFGRSGFGIELYDLKEEIVYNYKNNTIFDGNEFKHLYSNIFVTNFTLNNTNLYLLAYNNGDNLGIKICQFNSKNLENGITVLKETKLEVSNTVSPISCFISDSKIIICMYVDKIYLVEEQDIWILDKMYIVAYNQNLEEENKTEISNEISSVINKETYVYKSLHLNGNVGVFLYKTHRIYVINYNQEYNKFDNYFPEQDFNYFELTFTDENSNYVPPQYYTELLKITDSKICYISFPLSYYDEEIKGYYIFISLINFIGKETMITRYYYIKMFNLFGYGLQYSCKSNIYKDYISLSFSTYTYEDGDHTAFMLLSYANNTDQNFDIIDHLLNNNELKISNISKDLKDILVIENNIFGFKIERSEILEKRDCDNFDMKSVKSDKFIQTNSSLNLEDTLFYIKFNGNYIYYKGNCSIKLNLYITEPDFKEDNNYYDYINNSFGEFDENSYNEQKKIYGGKESIFNIELQKDLFTNCSNINCELCLMEDPDICITCKNNFTFYEEQKRKICESNVSDTIEISDSFSNTFNISDSVRDTFKTSDSIINTFEINDTILYSNEVINNISNKVEISNSILETNDINNSISNINEISDSILDIIKTCNKKELINENINENDFLSPEHIEEIFINLTIYTIKCNNTNESIIILAQNAIFEMSTIEFQKYYNNLNFSSVDLGQCENVLKDRYNIPKENSLLILKLDIKKIETKSTYVQYEIYDSVTLKKLNLDYCKHLNMKIIIYVPVHLNSIAISLYENLKKWGYNLFDSGDPFYHDVCTLFTNQYGTDVIIEDRRKDYYYPYNTIQLCQEGCDFNSYDKLVLKAKCYCNGQTDVVITDITKLHFDKDIIADSFLDTIKNSNFRVLKCYKVAIDLTTILTNLGRIILTLIFVLFLVLMIVYSVKEKKNINEKISYVLKDKLENFKDKEENKPKSIIKKKKKKKNKVKKHSVFKLENNEIKEIIDNDKKDINKININDVSSINNINYDNKDKSNKIKK